MKTNIKKILREQLILEGKHSYGCVMLYLDIPKKWWGNLVDDIDKDDVYTTDEKGEYGVTPLNEVHVTLLYGLHETIPDSDIEDIIDTLSAPKLELKNITSFNNETFDVLKFDVVGSSEKLLGKMNAKFAKLPHTTDYPDYHPHITIMYCKPDTAKKYIKTLSKDDAIILSPSKIVYSKADGSKKTYKFK